MRAVLPALATLLLTTSAQADPYCDTLMGYVHDTWKNAVETATIADRAGPQTVARVPLPGARWIVSLYNPTGVAKDHPTEQSVYCFWNASEDHYRDVLAQ